MAVSVESSIQIERESLDLAPSEPIPRLLVADVVDPHRHLKVTIPLDPSQATWVAFEESPLYMNEAHTKFIIRPPFEGRRAPRFIFYFPHDDCSPLDQHIFVSVVDENKPFDCDATSVWSVFATDAPPTTSPIAQGLITYRNEQSITILDQTRNTEVKFAWPNRKIRLERAAPFMTGSGDNNILLCSCDPPVPSPIGIRYGMAECMYARLSYMVDMKRNRGDDKTPPTYECVIQRQISIINDSSVSFSRISSICIASDTFNASTDGFPTRALTMMTSPESARVPQPEQLIQPFITVHQCMETIPSRGTLQITDHAAKFQQSFLVATIQQVPITAGEYANISVDAWFPTRELQHAITQPGVVQVHAQSGIVDFDDITAATFWDRSSDQADMNVEWSRLHLPGTAPRITVQCVIRQNSTTGDFATISAFNHFSRPMLLAFVVYPGQTNVCTDIAATMGAQPIADFPWRSSSRGTIYKVFLLNNSNDPISFRGTIN